MVSDCDEQRLAAGIFASEGKEANGVGLQIHLATCQTMLPMLGHLEAASEQLATRRTDMKLVSVIIRPYKLDDVREALSAIGVQGLTFTEVEGFGRQRDTSNCTAVPSTRSISYPK